MSQEREIAGRLVTHPMIDGFTDEFLIVRAGVDGAGGCPHLYEVYDKGVEPKSSNDPGVDSKLLCRIELQHGNPKEVGVNGIGNQTLMLIALDFLKKANAGEFSCRETSVVITKLEEAMQWTKQREMDRRARGVYLQHKK